MTTFRFELLHWKIMNILEFKLIVWFVICYRPTLPMESEEGKFHRTILEGQCQIRCLEKYGEKTKLSENRHYTKDIYLANRCVSRPCRQCLFPCSNFKTLEICHRNCSTHVCRRSCDLFKRTKEASEEISTEDMNNVTTELTISSPTDVCRYKNRKTGTTTVYLKWKLTEKGLSYPQLLFVISMRTKTNDSKTSQWGTIGKSPYSYCPIHNLTKGMLYQFRVTVVSKTGVVGIPEFTDWIQALADDYSVMPPTHVAIETQTFHKQAISALLTWKSNSVRPCFYKIFWMPTCKDKSLDFEEEELKAPPVMQYWMNRLHFGCNYTVNIHSYESPLFFKGSDSTRISFVTMDCLNVTNYNYSLCVPEAPWNITVLPCKHYYLEENDKKGNLTISWLRPPHTTLRNRIINYTVEWSKEIPLQFGPLVLPDKGNAVLPENFTKLFISGLHWPSTYRIDVRAISAGGISKPSTVFINLGNAIYEETFYNGTSLSLDRTADNKVWLGAVVGVICVVVTIIAIVIRFTRTRKHNYHGRIKIEETNPIYDTPDGNHGCDDPLLCDEYEVDFSYITFLEIIGEGAFGKVAKADLVVPRADGKDSDKTIVAVKMLKDFPDMNEKKSLMTEIEAMKQLGHHPNIVSMVGCCTRGPRICLIMDFCSLGDLRQYLLKQRTQAMYVPRYRRQSKDSGMCSNERDDSCSEPDLPLNQAQLLSYARQIAIGMEFLAEKKFIHRDLAARNILMSDTDRLKISDFGLTRDVYETNMYQPTSARKLPYKWMALEAIYDQTFTTKSDVWSFGIVLWEIVTLGGCPYPGIPNEDLFRLLKDGYRMENPGNCSPEIYQIMLSCWHPSPLCRPTFKELRTKLEAMLELTKPYINLTVTVSEDYYKDQSSDKQDTSDCEDDLLKDADVDISYIDVEPYQKKVDFSSIPILNVNLGYQKIFIQEGNGIATHDPCDSMCRLCTMQVSPTPSFKQRPIMSGNYEEPVSVTKQDINVDTFDVPNRNACLRRC